MTRFPSQEKRQKKKGGGGWGGGGGKDVDSLLHLTLPCCLSGVTLELFVCSRVASLLLSVSD